MNEFGIDKKAGQATEKSLETPDDTKKELKDCHVPAIGKMNGC